jgi:hypothetical protein
MDRRRFLLIAGAGLSTGLAGCAGGGDSGGGSTDTQTQAPTTQSPSPTVTDTPTPEPTTTETPTPEPASFAVVQTYDRTYGGNEDWAVEFVVANNGEQGGTFTDTLQFRLESGVAWEDLRPVSVYVPAGDTTEYQKEFDPLDGTGEVQFRLEETDARWTTTFEQMGSEWRGGGTSRRYVDVPYRDYTDDEVSEIRSSAQSYSYEDLYRNAESLRGEAIEFTGTVGQVLVGDPANMYFAQYEDTRNYVYASYVGDRYIEGDELRCWGQVYGLEVYVSGSGSEQTVPSLTLADVERTG